MLKCFFKLTVLVLWIQGCTVKPELYYDPKVELLAQKLQNLDMSVPYIQSYRLSKSLYLHTQALTQKFELTSPPLWHNFLVNIGIKEKGLCYHWSDALYFSLKKEGYPYYRFHRIGTSIGSYWKEHNALAITTSKQTSIQEGLLMDAWRNSGKLYISRVKEDTSYWWKERFILR